MNTFGDDEKSIVDKIVLGRGFSRNLINIFDSLQRLQGVRISVDPATRSAEYLFQIVNANPTQQELQAGIEREKQLTQELITHLLVLESLEKAGLAFFYTPTSPSTGKVEFGVGDVNMPSFSIPIYDSRIIDLLIRYVHLEIVPKPELVRLHHNKYKSDDERRFGIQMIATWSALAVSIIIGLIGIFNNYESDIESNKKHAEVISSVDANVAKIESSIKGLVIPDIVDYSKSIEHIGSSIDLVSKEIKALSQKQIIVNAKVEIPAEEYNRSMQPTAKASAD